MSTQPQIIRKPDVIKMAGFSKSTLYNRIQQGLWPKPISLGFRAVGFIQAECETVIKAMIAEQSQAEIQQLVSELIQQRKVA